MLHATVTWVAVALATLVVAQIPPESATIIDILSQTGQFSELLRHLQRTGLVPFINTQRNITLAAPDNGAFAQFDGKITRELLLYHIINGTATFENTTEGTSIFPSAFEDAPVKVDIDHKHDSMKVNGVSVVETDLVAGSQRGVVQVLEAVLDAPKPIWNVISHHDSISKFAKLVNSNKYTHDLPSLPHMTLLAPTNSAIDHHFSPLMYAYLSTFAGARDVKRLIEHFVLSEMILAQNIAKKFKFTALDGTEYVFDDKLAVDGTAPFRENIIAKNGIIHTYHSMLTSNFSSVFEFTPRKALEGLHLEQFVALLELAELTELVNNSSISQSIFAPVEKPAEMWHGINYEGVAGEGEQLDDTIHLQTLRTTDLTMDQQVVLHAAIRDEMTAHSADVVASRRAGLYSEGAAYHFTKKPLSLSPHVFDGKNHLLVDTKMRSKKIGYRAQRLKLRYDETSKEIFLNDRRIVDSEKFGSEKFTVGNTSIYLIDEELEPPSGLASSVAPIFHTSRSLFYLNELGRLKLPLNYAGWTIILPTTTAWDGLGVVTEYLTSNKTALTLLFDSLIFHKPFYSDSKKTKLPTYQERHNATLEFIRDDGSDFVVVNGNRYRVNEAEYDVLFNSGVVHTVENVFVPKALDITAQQLISTINPDFVTLLAAANLTYTLDPSRGFSFLVPSEDSMTAENITIHSENLGDYMKLHILQNNTLTDEGSEDSDGYVAGRASTLFGVSLQAKKIAAKLFMIQIVQGIDREARILNQGVASNNATVFSVDRPLNPAWVIPDNPWFPSHDHLRTPVAIFIGIIIGLVAFFAILSCFLWIFLGRSAKDNEDEERTTTRDAAATVGGSGSSAAPSKKRPKSRADILRQEANAETPLLAGNNTPKYSTAPMSVNQPRKNGRGLKIGPN